MTVVLYIAIGGSVVAYPWTGYSEFRFLSIQYATLVVVAITLRFLAVRLRLARTGVVLLASWSVSMLAAWMGVASDGVASYDCARGAGQLLMPPRRPGPHRPSYTNATTEISRLAQLSVVRLG